MVYGAFSYSRKGQQVVGKTPGVSPEIEREIVNFCNSWGDCRNFKFRRSLNQFLLQNSSPAGQALIAVVKIINAGKDQIGREGALVRHALILTESDYRNLEFNPYLLESQGAFLTAWTRQSNCQLIYLSKKSIPPADFSEIPRRFYDELHGYLLAILSGGEIYLYLNNHINTAEDIIYYLMKLLPMDLKKKIAMTTFAFKKNINYKIGCYYRASGVVSDPLKVRFEILGENKSAARRFADILFENMRDEKFGKVVKLIAQPLDF
jgi:hypothetical protein